MLDIEPLTASTGMEALDLVKSLQGKIDLMIIDLFLPKMNGEETLEKLREFYPDCPVLFVSGYDGTEKKYTNNENFRFLKKPFTILNLQNTILDLIQP